MNQTPEWCVRLARHVYSHHQYTLAISIQFARLPAAFLLRRHNVLAASATQATTGHPPKIPDFPTSAAAVAGQFSLREHETSNPFQLPDVPGTLAQRCTGAIGPYRNRSRGPLVAQSWLSQMPESAAAALRRRACLRACLACLRETGSGESCLRSPAACSSQPASPPRRHSDSVPAYQTSHHITDQQKRIRRNS